MNEVWLPIAGYEGLYEVSDQGSVRRVGRLNARYGSNRKLIGDIDHKGYPRVLLSRNLIKRRFFVHRLVCAAFHGEPPPGTEVGHRNGVRSDARAENLRWVTRSENNKDTITHGHWNSPTKGRPRKDHPMAKYSDETISQIIADMHAGLGSRRISKKYGISQTYAGHIKRVHVKGVSNE